MISKLISYKFVVQKWWLYTQNIPAESVDTLAKRGCVNTGYGQLQTSWTNIHPRIKCPKAMSLLCQHLAITAQTHEEDL